MIDAPLRSGPMHRLTPDQAQASIARLLDDLAKLELAGRRSRTGTPSTIDLLGQWQARIQRAEMEPDALPTLFAGQARRHRRADAITGPLLREERALRRARGETGGRYGAIGYFGRHALDDDD